jgi:hypothetical protein
LAKNGMLQLRMNLMKKQKSKLEDRIKTLEQEKEVVKKEFESQEELMMLLQKQNELVRCIRKNFHDIIGDSIQYWRI